MDSGPQSPVDYNGPVVPIRLSSKRNVTADELTLPTFNNRPSSVASTYSLPNFARIKSQLSMPLPDYLDHPVLPLMVSRAPSRAGTERRKSLPIKRWDGIARKASHWESLRRDSELFVPGADCAIHFHARGKSQRGPSLLVPLEKVKASGCLPLLRNAHRRSSSSVSSMSDSGYSSTGSEDEVCNLYIPAPDYISREDAHDWHLTTRNVFAWIVDKPLVGYTLGQAMINLLERLLTIRPATLDSRSDCVDYAERMGYLDMVDQPDFAIAMLNFAEHSRLRDVWTNAFIHCAGQNDILYLSPEFQAMTRKTQASITRAYLRMDLKVTNATRHLGNFLEEDLSSSQLGLTSSQRNHLDRFRSFIHSFYVAKLGYWPPTEYKKHFLQNMHDDFQCLYDLLADKQSSFNQHNTASGGLCVLQNVSSFDDRHQYEPLAHPLPIIPRNGKTTGKMLAVRHFRMSLSSKPSRREMLLNAWAELLEATNQLDPYVRECGFVQAYLSFEQECLVQLESDLSIADARKVRWIQVYYILQTLKSITPTVPSDATYHTCVTVPAIPWSSSNRMSALAVHPALRTPPSSEPSTSPPATPCAGPAESPMSIHPDCETEDYFAPKVLPRKDSSISVSKLTSSPALSRATSILHMPRRTSTLSLGSYKRSSGIFNAPPATDLAPFSPIVDDLAAIPNATSDWEVFELPATGTRTPTLETVSLPLGPFELDAADNMLTFFDETSSVADSAVPSCASDDGFDGPELGLTKGDLDDGSVSEYTGSEYSTSTASGSDVEQSGLCWSSGSSVKTGETEWTGRTLLTPVLETESEVESPGSAKEWADVYGGVISAKGGYFGDVVDWVDVPRRQGRVFA